MTLVVTLGLVWIGLCLSTVGARLGDLAREMRRSRQALEAQNRHYGIATIDQEGTDGTIR